MKKPKRNRKVKIKTGDLSPELVAQINLVSKEWSKLYESYTVATEKLLTPLADAIGFQDAGACICFIEEGVTPSDSVEILKDDLIRFVRETHLIWLQADIDREKQELGIR